MISLPEKVNRTELGDLESSCYFKISFWNEKGKVKMVCYHFVRQKEIRIYTTYTQVSPKTPLNVNTETKEVVDYWGWVKIKWNNNKGSNNKAHISIEFWLLNHMVFCLFVFLTGLIDFIFLVQKLCGGHGWRLGPLHRFLDGQRKEIDLLQGLDFHVLD